MFVSFFYLIYRRQKAEDALWCRFRLMWCLVFLYYTANAGKMQEDTVIFRKLPKN